MKSLKARKQQGATMIEYGLIVALIAVVCIGVVGALGTTLTALFQGVSDQLTAAGASTP